MTDLETRDTQPAHAYAALGFTCEAAIRAGLLDPWLLEIWRAVRYRRMILDPDRIPAIPLPGGQAWVWIYDRVYHEGDPVEPPGHWEPRGCYGVLDEDEPQRKDPAHV